MISNLQDCEFDPYRLVGERISCGESTVTITNVSARIYERIYDGPRTLAGSRLWYGFNPGTGFNGLYPGNLQLKTVNGKTTATAQELSDNFIRYLLKRDPTYNTSHVTYMDYDELFFPS